ncbi:MAG: AsmA family protein [bacterium]|nr:AsmA family protein [bacterium]MDE0415494.1 AsmA family protein [bacterium]
MRKVFWIAAALVVVLLAAGAFWHLTRDLDRYRDEVEKQLEALTGRNVTVSGDLSLALVPDLKVALSDVTIGDEHAPWLSLPEVHAVVSLTSLLTLDLAIERIRIVGPALTVGGPDMTGALTAGRATPHPEVRIDTVEIVDATVTWHSKLQGTRVFEGLDLAVESKGVDGPFEITGSLSGNGGGWTLEGALGRLTRSSLPVGFAIMSDDGTSLRASGSLQDWKNEARFAGTVRLDVPDLGRLTGLAAAQALPASFDAVTAISADAVEISDLALQFDDSVAFGTIESSAGQLAVRMNSSRLDFDHLVALAQEMDSDHPVFAWLRGRHVSMDVAIEHALYRNQTARQVEVVASVADGTVDIERAAALLPGNTHALVTGVATIKGDVPIFRGPLDVTSSDLRSTLGWLGVDLEGIPRDRLRTARLSAHCEATPGSAVLSGMDLVLDSSRVTGTLISLFAGKRSFIADLGIDELALDAYLPAGLPDTLPEIEWTGFALDVRSKIGTLVMGDVVATGVFVDGAVNQGAIEFRRLEARDVSGAAVRATGTIEPAHRSLAFDVEIGASDMGAIARRAGIETSFDLYKLGTVDLSLAAHGSFDDIDLEGVLATAVADFTVRGHLARPLAGPSFQGVLDVEGESLVAAADVVGLDVPEGEGEPFMLTADIDLTPHELSLAIAAESLGATLDADGRLRNAVLEEGSAVLKHADTGDLMDYWGLAGGADLEGPLDIAVKVTGSLDQGMVEFERASVGPSSFEGAAEWSTADARPVIHLRLAADTIVLDALASRLPGVINDVDGRVDLVADHLFVGGVSLDDVLLRSAAEGGVLHLETLSGSLFGGTVLVSGAARYGLPHEMTYSLALEDGELREVLVALAGRDTLSGRLQLAVDGTARGLTGEDLLQSLAGEGRISLRRGAVEGFDFQAMAGLLSDGPESSDIAEEMLRSTGEGTSEIITAGASFSMSRGVVRSDDLSVIFNGAEGNYEIEVDLPRHWINLDGSVQLTGSTGLPAVAMSVAGPLDETDLVFDTRLLETHLVSEPVPLPEDKPPVPSDMTVDGDAPAAAEPEAPESETLVNEPQEDDGSLLLWVLDEDDGSTQAPPPAPDQEQDSAVDAPESGSILLLLD